MNGNSFWYDSISRYYNLGYYTEENMRTFVFAGRISEQEFEEITGIPYNQAEVQPQPIV